MTATDSTVYASGTGSTPKPMPDTGPKTAPYTAPSVAAGMAAHSGHSFGADRRWQARLALGFDAPAAAGRTRLRSVQFQGPLRVQRPFYPEECAGGYAEPCHCYVLHPPGGMVSGDALEINLDVAARAHALLTTPSAGKIYGADACQTTQQQTVRAQVSGGALEWLPQETIIFDGAHARLETQIAVEADATLLGWESVCLGRPAAGEGFTHGSVRQRLHITRGGLPLLYECLRMDAQSPLHTAACGLRGQTAFMTLYAVPPANQADAMLADCHRRCLDALAQWQASPAAASGSAGVTVRGSVLLARYLGNDTCAAQQLAIRLWQAMRPCLLGREAVMPRIWNT